MGPDVSAEETHTTEGELSAHIDCDVHLSVPADEVVEYLPPNYRNQQGYNVPAGLWTAASNRVPDTTNDVGDEELATPEEAAKTLFEDHDAAVSVLNPYETLRLATSPQVDYAHALARAYNEWFLEKWLDRDDRFRGSMLVAPQRPTKAAEEIRRVGDHPQVVQVMVGSATELPYGRDHYWPIYEAAANQGLPVAIHPGVEGYGVAPPSGGAGYPQTALERETAQVDHLLGQLISLVAEGTFVEYPELEVVFPEAGVGWLPTALWRMDKDWKSLRAEVPYLDQPPSSYVREHCWFGTAPWPAAPPEDLVALIELVDGEELLVYGSNYPHADRRADDLQALDLPEATRRRILRENAADLYGLDELVDPEGA